MNGTNHLDEGTIHAWLDGALDAAHARDAEAHVARCETCAAAVADARGLIAGASRILVALDDVPGGVIPKRTPMPKAPSAPRRQWRAARWVTGIAAALMLAVGVTTWNRDAVKQEMTSTTMAVRAAPQPANDQAATSGPVSQSVSPAPLGAQARDGKGRTDAPSAVVAEAEGAQKKAAPSDVAARLGSAKKLEDVVVTSTAAPPAAAPTAGSGGVVGSVAGNAASQQPAPTVATGAAAPVAARRERAEESSDATGLAGCYRTDVVTSTELQRAEVSSDAASAGALSRSATSTRKATASAPAERRAQPAAEPATVQAPTVVRLDTLRSATGYVARNAAGDAAVGSWLPVGRDSVRVDLQRAGVFTFSRSARAVCP